MSSTGSEAQQNGSDGRAYTQDQVLIVKKVLRAKEGGRGAHYRVLDIPSTATESDIKKAYRKLSLKVHPDKVCSFVRFLSLQAFVCVTNSTTGWQKSHTYSLFDVTH